MRLTFEDIMALRPCWTPEAVADYFDGRKYVQHTTVLRDHALSYSDRMWLAVKLMPDDRARRLFACDCAERALEHVPAGEERPRRAVEVARQYAAGEATDDELAVARSAAWVAACAAARSAAWASAGVAARAAACDAACDAALAATWAARGAAGDAAWAAAGDAAWAARGAASAAARASAGTARASAWGATERQIERAIEYLEGL